MRAVLDSDAPHAAELLQQVPTWFEEWEVRLSRFRAKSELTLLNQHAGRYVSVSRVLWQVIQLALAAARESDGLVTPTMLNALEAAGYDHSLDDRRPPTADRPTTRPPDHPTTRPPTTRPPDHPTADHPFAWREIEMDARTQSVCLPPNVRLDLGGIAKEWAAEQVARRLGAFAPALTDAGGDIAVSGARANGDKWAIGIAAPATGMGETRAGASDLPLLMLERGGVATSGRDYRRWLKNGIPQHHIIDPRTSRPAETDVLTATVVAPTVLRAQVAAKVALILGSRAGMDWIEARPELAGIVILEDGRLVQSRRMQEYVWQSQTSEVLKTSEV